MIELNEKHNVQMTPSPRDNLKKIYSNIDNTVHMFITNAVESVSRESDDWPDQIVQVIKSILNSQEMTPFLKKDHIERLYEYKKQAEEELKERIQRKESKSHNRQISIPWPL